MEHTEIVAAVLAHGMEILIATEPDKLDLESIAPFRLCGTFRYRGAAVPVECTVPDKESAFLMGVALQEFARHVARVKEGAQLGDSVEFLERLHRL